MDLAGYQQVFARLATDRAFRERFLAEPQREGGACGLAPGDARMLAGVSCRRFEFFARSLVNKRLGDVRKIVPMVAQAIGGQFAARFREYAEASPGARATPPADALAFLGFLLHEHRLGRDGGLPLDVVRLDQARLLVSLGQRRLVVRFLQGMNLPGVRWRGRVFVIFVRVRRSGAIRQIVLPAWPFFHRKRVRAAVVKAH